MSPPTPTPPPPQRPKQHDARISCHTSLILKLFLPTGRQDFCPKCLSADTRTKVHCASGLVMNAFLLSHTRMLPASCVNSHHLLLGCRQGVHIHSQAAGESQHTKSVYRNDASQWAVHGLPKSPINRCMSPFLLHFTFINTCSGIQKLYGNPFAKSQSSAVLLRTLLSFLYASVGSFSYTCKHTDRSAFVH